MAKEQNRSGPWIVARSRGGDYGCTLSIDSPFEVKKVDGLMTIMWLDGHDVSNDDVESWEPDTIWWDKAAYVSTIRQSAVKVVD